MQTLETLAESIKLMKPKRLDVCSATSATGSYLFANDLHSANQKDYLDFHKKLPKGYTPLSIAIIVGNGNIISLLPEINAQTILLCDIDPKVSAFLTFIKDFLLEKNERVSDKNFEGFQLGFKASAYRFAKETLQQTITMTTKNDRKSKLEDEMSLCGDMHYLANLDRYKQCCIALQNKKIVPVEIDLFDLESLKMLRDNIHNMGYEITYMNLSNVSDYDSKGILQHLLSSFTYGENFRGIITSLNNQKFGPEKHLTGYIYTVAKLIEFISKNSIESKLYHQTMEIEYISTPILATYGLNPLTNTEPLVEIFNKKISRLIREYVGYLGTVESNELFPENTQQTFTPALELEFNTEKVDNNKPIVSHSCYM